MEQQRLIEEADAARSLLDQLLIDSRLYKNSQAYKDLLDFVIRLRNFAPFNAMLLQVQKPGLSYAASACDWRARFGRQPKEGARPLLILWPFGPVALVYDVQDTEGKELPRDVAAFFATGPIDRSALAAFETLTIKEGIEWCAVDAGDQRAGSIRVLKRPSNDKERTLYRMHVNRNHPPATQFATLVHELGHLFLGHLGRDKKNSVPPRTALAHAMRELEAESVSYIVCKRQNIFTNSEKYLSDYVTVYKTIDDIDVYQVLRAAGQVEKLLGLTGRTGFDKPISLVGAKP